MSTSNSHARAAARSIHEAVKAGASLPDIIAELGKRSVGDAGSLPTTGHDFAPQDQVLADAFDKGRIDAWIRDESDLSVC
jgi:hypothetical protein